MTMDYEERTKSRFPIIGLAVVDLAEKIFVPENDYPDHNFLGSIIGPKGSTMKNLAKTTKCRISVLGRHSMRDRDEEDRLVDSDEPEHQHLKEPLHVLINIKAPAHIAYARMSNAIKEINKFMVPGLSVTSPVISPVGGGGGPILHYGIPPPGAIILGQPSGPIAQHLKPTSNHSSNASQQQRKQSHQRTSISRDTETNYDEDSTSYYDRQYGAGHSSSDNQYNEDSDQYDGNYKRNNSGYNSSRNKSSIMDNYYR